MMNLVPLLPGQAGRRCHAPLLLVALRLLLLLLHVQCGAAASTSHHSHHRHTISSNNNNAEYDGSPSVLRNILQTRSPLYAFKQRFLRRELQSSGSRQRQTAARKSISGGGGRAAGKKRGSCFSLQHPNRQNVALWFGRGGRRSSSSSSRTSSSIMNNRAEEEDDAGTVRNQMQATSASHCCNHALAGMTNPTLTIMNHHNDDGAQQNFELQQHQQQQAIVPVSVSTTTTTVPSGADNHDSSTAPRLLAQQSMAAALAANNKWWPGVSCQPDRSWRVLRFRQTVGVGLDCYQACRDAALAWEFDGGGGKGGGNKGIVAVVDGEQRSGRINRHRDGAFYRHPAPQEQQLLQASPSDRRRRGWLGGDGDPVLACSATLQQEQQESQQQQVQQIWWGPGRRLVTYTAVTGLGWLPKIKLYTISPVTVIYDLVDQRGSDTTYTATAYATGKGHWLRGEERVVVCHRDDGDTVDIEILSYSKASDSLTGRLVWPLIGRMQRSFFEQQMRAFQRVADDTPSFPFSAISNHQRAAKPIRMN